ncbi:hypothetical protein QCE63_21640 [Caballeronia sp. LZ065]|nr:hypothetical protein [Caballeronia sp. LZ065]MDR5782005.1 hypothetical protein [Caballeronia sp. LZ065]
MLGRIDLVHGSAGVVEDLDGLERAIRFFVAQKEKVFPMTEENPQIKTAGIENQTRFGRHAHLPITVQVLIREHAGLNADGMFVSRDAAHFAAAFEPRDKRLHIRHAQRDGIRADTCAHHRQLVDLKIPGNIVRIFLGDPVFKCIDDFVHCLSLVVMDGNEITLVGMPKGLPLALCLTEAKRLTRYCSRTRKDVFSKYLKPA